MAKLTAEEQQRVIKEFQRVRRNELLISIPVLAGAFVLVLLYRYPRYQIAGVGGVELAMAAGVALAVGIVLHYRNWRCPACGRILRGRGVTTGFCGSCGALFLSKEEVLMAEKAKLSPAERALKGDVQIYAARTARPLMAGIVAVVTGVSLLIWGPNRYDEPRPDLWPYRTFGPSGAGMVKWGVGIGLVLLGAYLLNWAIRRSPPAYEAKMRKLLGLPPAGGGAAT